MSKIKIYISGQITGLEREQAFKNFEDAEQLLESVGFEVLNPMKLNPYQPEWSWQQYMVEDIRELFECQAIFLLPNWLKSKGARIELRIAAEMGHLIFTESQSKGRSFLTAHRLNQQLKLWGGESLFDEKEISDYIESEFQSRTEVKI